MDIENNKPVNNIIRYIVVFYEEPPQGGTWGSNDIVLNCIIIQKME